jgi:hypothetical protein
MNYEQSESIVGAKLPSETQEIKVFICPRCELKLGECNKNDILYNQEMFCGKCIIMWYITYNATNPAIMNIPNNIIDSCIFD